MNSLFDEDEALTDEGSQLKLRVDAALQPILVDAEAAGYPLREVVSLVIYAVEIMAARLIFVRRRKKVR